MAYLIILTVETELDDRDSVDKMAAEISDYVFIETKSTVSWEIARLDDAPDD